MTALPMTTLTRLAPAPDTAAPDAKTLRRRPVLAKEGHPAVRPVAAAHLTDEDVAELGRELDAIRDAVLADRGAKDAAYIRRVIRTQRSLEIGGRACLVFASLPPAWVAGVAMLSVAKILENMEIGHNVLHGQWDWMNDPVINSSAWDWDTASTAEAWKHSHNYVHHTYTNIRGKDRDLGYEIMRIDPHQPWHPVYLLQPLYNLALMAFFEWGVAFHDLDIDAIRAGEKSKEDLREELKGIVHKARLQIQKDYVSWPALSAAIMTGVEYGVFRATRRKPKRRFRREPEPRFDALAAARRTFLATLTADAAANIVRNLWAHGIIFCGHFPDQTLRIRFAVKFAYRVFFHSLPLSAGKKT